MTDPTRRILPALARLVRSLWTGGALSPARWRVPVIMAGLAVCLLAPVVGSSPAEATSAANTVPAIPTGTDCLRPPTPASPTAGLPAWIDPGPANAPTGDPFAKDSGTSLYDVYGYAGYDAIIYDPGCFDTSRLWDAPNEAANAMTGIAATGIAIAVKLTRLVMQGDLGSLWQPLQSYALDFLGHGIFLPLLGLGVLATGVVITSRARRGDVAGETRISTFSVAIILGGFLALSSGLTVGAAIDQGITSTFAAANQLLSKSEAATTREPADAVAANLVGQVLYQTWANETFGGDEQAAKEYGPKLFAAGALTRAEQKQIDADPKKAASLIESKKTAYKAVAREIESKRPQAYSHLAGNDTRTRTGYALAGLIGAGAGVGYLIFALIKTIWAMVIARIGIGATPLVALIAQMPRWQHLAMELLTWVVEAIAKAAAFGFLFVVFLAGGIGGIMDPSTTWHPLVKAAALVMASIAMHLLLKRLGLVGAPWRAPRLRRSGLGRLATEGALAAAMNRSHAESSAGSSPAGPAASTAAKGTPPREALQLTRSLPRPALTAGATGATKALRSGASGIAATAATAPLPGAPVIALGRLASATTAARSTARSLTTVTTPAVALGSQASTQAGSQAGSATRRALPGSPRPAELPWRPTAPAGGNPAMTTKRVVTGRVVEPSRLYRPPATTAATAGASIKLYRPQGAKA